MAKIKSNLREDRVHTLLKMGFRLKSRLSTGIELWEYRGTVLLANPQKGLGTYSLMSNVQDANLIYRDLRWAGLLNVLRLIFPDQQPEHPREELEEPFTPNELELIDVALEVLERRMTNFKGLVASYEKNLPAVIELRTKITKLKGHE